MRPVNWRDKIWFDSHKIERFRSLIEANGAIRRAQIGPKFRGLAYDVPWAFVGSYGRGCSLLNDFLWNDFKIIPRACREACWKVCVRPQSVYELYHLHLIQHQLHGLHGWSSKAGIDTRAYTFGRYGGYFYHRDFKEAQECYEVVRDIIDESQHFRLFRTLEQTYDHEYITVKKGCTEMQHPGFGGIPSDQWESCEQIPDWNDTEDHINDILTSDDSSECQPPWLHNKIIYTWMEYAHMTGDPSYREVMGEDPFAYEEKTYHLKKGGDTLSIVDEEVADFKQVFDDDQYDHIVTNEPQEEN